MANFEDVFDTEKAEIQYETIHQRALEEHWCCTCEYYKSEPDGDWCTFYNTVACGPCLLYTLKKEYEYE